MDSLSKISLGRSQIEHLVEAAFGKDVQVGSIEEIKDGWFNTIYSISFCDEREIILKIAPPNNFKVLRYEKNIMNTEVQVLKLLKKTGKVPVPDVYSYDATGTLIENEYFFMEKVSGESFSKIRDSITEDEQGRIEAELGAFNRSINDITGNRFGYISQQHKTASSWFDAFRIMVDDILLDGKEYGVKLPMDYDKIEQLFLSNVHAFDSVKEPRLVHWDLHDGNVIVGDDGHISGIIDCDRAIWGDPLIEFYFGDFQNSANFIKGYGKNPLADSDAKCRRILYNIYLYLIMVIESYYRRYDDAHKSWTYKTLGNELRKL